MCAIEAVNVFNEHFEQGDIVNVVVGNVFLPATVI
jgi:hypothetical protein